jgi:hypothetical protein
MPADVLADIPICLLRFGVSRLLPNAFCPTYLAFMHSARCGVTQSVGSQFHFGWLRQYHLVPQSLRDQDPSVVIPCKVHNMVGSLVIPQHLVWR